MHTNYSMHTQYPNGLIYSEDCDGSIYGNHVHYETETLKFKHHLNWGSGHELTYRGSDHQVFKSSDQRTEKKSQIDRTNGLVEGNTKTGHIQMTNCKEMYQYKPR